DIVKGAGNSSSPLSYGCTDRRPYRGQSQYRLKQTDFDGTFSYSHIENVSIRSAVAALHVYPNPTWDHITVEGDRAELVSVELYSLLGKRMTHLVEINRLSEGALRMQLDALAPGSYVLRTRSGAHRIIKQ
ncbi:MAG: T9SS type A sorting domain-containing protein, partial [Bacteroidota bacterium]